MAYYFESFDALADSYRAKLDQAAKDAERVSELIRVYEGRTNPRLSPSARVNIETNMRNMGGINYQREVLRGHNTARVVWREALEMLQAAIRDNVPSRREALEAFHRKMAETPGVVALGSYTVPDDPVLLDEFIEENKERFSRPQPICKGCGRPAWVVDDQGYGPFCRAKLRYNI